MNKWRFTGLSVNEQLLCRLLNSHFFLHKRDMLEQLLSESLPLTGADTILLKIELIDGHAARRVVDAHTIIDFAYNGLTAMARMTAFPAAIIAQALANGTIEGRGVLTQEQLFPDPSYMVDELVKRGINFLET